MNLQSTQRITIVGIDINKNGAVLSFMEDRGTEASTLTLEDKEGSRVIPLCMAKERGLGRWYTGEEAAYRAISDGALITDDLYQKALLGGAVNIEGRDYLYEELFFTYIRRIIEEAGIPVSGLRKLVFTVPLVDVKVVELFESANKALSLDRGVISVIDHKEGFMYYTLSQNPTIYSQNVVMLEYEPGRILSYLLSRDTGLRPQVINIKMNTRDTLQGDLDSELLSFARSVLEPTEVSSVFLTGDFDTDILPQSIEYLCSKGRVFMGDNLFSKGAAFAGKIKLRKLPWEYVYIGDHEMKMNLSLKIIDQNEMGFLTLVEAGDSWYETGESCEVILDGTPEFECWIQSPQSRSAKIQKIELRNLPKRENRTTRLRITAKPLSPVKVAITILDLGFGDIAPKSDMIWNHEVDLMEDLNG